MARGAPVGPFCMPNVEQSLEPLQSERGGHGGGRGACRKGIGPCLPWGARSTRPVVHRGNVESTLRHPPTGVITDTASMLHQELQSKRNIIATMMKQMEMVCSLPASALSQPHLAPIRTPFTYPLSPVVVDVLPARASCWCVRTPPSPCSVCRFPPSPLAHGLLWTGLHVESQWATSRGGVDRVSPLIPHVHPHPCVRVDPRMDPAQSP